LNAYKPKKPKGGVRYDCECGRRILPSKKEEHEKTKSHKTIIEYGFDIYKIPYSTSAHIEFKKLDLNEQEKIRKIIKKDFD